MAMLEVRDLEVYYGVIQAIKGISFDVDQGEIVALIGANGAGKTTTLHTITGLIHAKSGKIVYEGTDITKVPGYKLVGMGIAHVPEGRRVFATLTVLQNLKMGAYTRKDRMRWKQPLRWYTAVSPVWRNVRTSLREPCPEVSSRCLPWEGPL